MKVRIYLSDPYAIGDPKRILAVLDDAHRCGHGTSCPKRKESSMKPRENADE
jgi:hypothetical protein